MVPSVHLDPNMRYERPVSTPETIGGAVTASAFLHVALLVLTAVGMPLIAKDPLIITNTPMTVEIVKIEDTAKTNRVATPVKVEDPQEDPAPTPDNPLAPKMESEAPPDLMAPQAPEIEDAVAEPREAPPPPEALKNITKPKPKPEVPKKAVVQKVQDNKFNSLLKNLAPDASEQRSIEEVLDQSPDTSPASGQLAQLANRLSMSEQDALKAQLGQCWNVVAGAKYAEDIVVEVRVFVNPDRTVRDAQVLNQAFGGDPHFRAAADAALRALRNPRCSPLKLPEGKYDQWKTMVINFDPREML